MAPSSVDKMKQLNHKLIHHFLEYSAERYPDKIALIHEDTRAKNPATVSSSSWKTPSTTSSIDIELEKWIHI